MTQVPEPERIEATPQHWRFQISLKAVFGVVTFLCLLLGYFVALDRSHEEMLARSWAVTNLIGEQYHQAPINTTRVPLRTRQARQQNSQQVTPFPVSSHYRIGILGHTTRSAMVWESTLDTTRALADGSTLDVARQILDHFETGLGALDLQRVAIGGPYGRGGIPERGATAYSIWQSFDHGMSVVIEVAVDPAPETLADTPMADVRIIFTHNEHKWLW